MAALLDLLVSKFYSLLAALLIGWHTVIASFVFAVIGMLKRRALWVIAAAILYTPFAWYLGMTPRFRYYAWLLPLLPVGAAVAVRLGVVKLAWIFLCVLFAFTFWLALVIFFGDIN